MMDNKQIAKQMIQFNKTAFDSSFSTLTMVYEQNEKMLETFINQATGMPEEGKKAIKDFKKLVDDSYAKVEEFFNKE